MCYQICSLSCGIITYVEKCNLVKSFLYFNCIYLLLCRTGAVPALFGWFYGGFYFTTGITVCWSSEVYFQFHSIVPSVVKLLLVRVWESLGTQNLLFVLQVNFTWWGYNSICFLTSINVIYYVICMICYNTACSCLHLSSYHADRDLSCH